MEIKPLAGRPDDIDFILEQFNPDGNNWLKTRISVNGPNVNRLPAASYCNGANSGLKDSESPNPELDGCNPTTIVNSDGYVLTVNAAIGSKYRLFVNNWYTNDGFTISFTNDPITSCKFTSCRASTQNGSKISSNGNNKNPNEILNSELLIAPNPTNEIFTATYEQTEKENAIFELYDYSGRLIEIQKSDAEQYRHTISFDLNNKPNGLYYLKVKTQSNQISKPIIKQ